MLCSVGSGVAAHRLSWPGACEIFPDQRSHPCPLHWQVNSLPLDHPSFVLKLEEMKSKSHLLRHEPLTHHWKILYTAAQERSPYLRRMRLTPFKATHLKLHGILWCPPRYFLIFPNNSLADFTRNTCNPPRQMTPILPKRIRVSSATTPSSPYSYGRQGVCEAVGGVFTTITSDPLFKYSNRKENLRPMGLGVRIRTSQEKSKTSNRISNVNYSSIKKKKEFPATQSGHLQPGFFPSVKFPWKCKFHNYKKCASSCSYLSLISQGLPKLLTSPFSNGTIREYSVVQSTSSSRVIALFASCPNCSKQSTLESRKETLILYNKILSSFKFLKSYVSLRKYTKRERPEKHLRYLDGILE